MERKRVVQEKRIRKKRSKPRDYKRAYSIYEGKPKQRTKNNARQRARRFLEKLGRVKKGDGKDIHHKDHNPLNNSLKNLRVVSRGRNRSRKI